MPSFFSKIRRLSGSKDASADPRCVSIDEDDDTEHSILYQMTCRDSHCKKGCSHLKFKSHFTSTNAAKNKRLTKILKTHYQHVWAISQQHNEQAATNNDGDDVASICSSAHEDELLNYQGLDSDFSTCSLARHLAKHCATMDTEREAIKWLMKNTRVEMKAEANIMAEPDLNSFVGDCVANSKQGSLWKTDGRI